MSSSRKQLFAYELEDCYHLNLPSCKHTENKLGSLCSCNPYCLRNINVKSLENVAQQVERCFRQLTITSRGSGYPVGLYNSKNFNGVDCIINCLFCIFPFTMNICLLDISESFPFSYNLQRMFYFMMNSTCQSVDSSEFISILKDIYTEPYVFDFFNHLMYSLRQESPYVSSLQAATQLFHGKRLLTKQCLNCHNVFYTPEEFMYLECPVSYDCRLEDILQEQFSRKSCQQPFVCPSCRCNVDSEDLISIKELPSILPIHIDRKLPQVDFQLPSRLQMELLCSIDRTSHSTEYVLTGVIYQHGKKYSCDVLHNNGWYYVDGMNVTKIQSRSIAVNWTPNSHLSKSYSFSPPSMRDISMIEKSTTMVDQENETTHVDEESLSLQSLMSLFQRISPNEESHQAFDDFVYSYNTVMEKELQAIKVERKRYHSAMDADSELKDFFEENDRNIKKVEALLQVMYNLKKEAVQNLPRGFTAESNSTDKIDFSKCSVMCFYCRKDTLEQYNNMNSSLGSALDSVNYPVYEQVKSECGETTKMQNLFIAAVKLFKERSAFVSKWLNDLVRASLVDLVYIRKADFERWIKGNDIISNFIRFLKDGTGLNGRDKTESQVILTELEKSLVVDAGELTCPHGRVHPVVFRKHFKCLPLEFLVAIKDRTHVSIPYLKEDEVKCSVCANSYSKTIKRISESFKPLFRLYNTLVEYIHKTKVSENDSDCFYISKQFVLSLKQLIIEGNVLLDCIPNVEADMLSQCDYTQLSPTIGLACTHHRLIEAQSKDRLAISEELWKEVQRWYPKCAPLQKSTPVCEFCSSAETTSFECDPPSKPLSESTTPSTRPESFYSPSFVEEQQRQTDFLEKYLSEDTIDGDGFIPASFSNSDILLMESSIISPSTIGTSSPSALLGGYQESMQTNTIPTGSSLFQLLENNQLSSSTYYIRTIPAAQRRQLLLQNGLLTSLIHRQTPISKAYFTKRPEIKDGCYFVFSSKWLRSWRAWLLNDSVNDVNSSRCDLEYQNVQEIQFTQLCQHAMTVIPGYMNHFILGYSALPCSDLSQNQDADVELVADFEFAALIKHHTFSSPFAGFFYGVSDAFSGLMYMPGCCRYCQDAENTRYCNYICSLPLQRIVISSYGRVLSFHEERKIRFTPKDHHYLWIQNLDPDTPTMTLKFIIKSRIRRNVETFRLRTRNVVLDESRTLQENGVNAETVLYVEFL